MRWRCLLRAMVRWAVGEENARPEGDPSSCSTLRERGGGMIVVASVLQLFAAPNGVVVGCPYSQGVIQTGRGKQLELGK